MHSGLVALQVMLVAEGVPAGGTFKLPWTDVGLQMCSQQHLALQEKGTGDKSSCSSHRSSAPK